jgi:hypothetical protein
MTITSAGNVGIGLTNPAHKLQVNGNVMLSTADGFMYLSNVGTGNSGIYVRGIGGSNILRSHSTGQFTWEVTGSEKMRLTSGGSVLINATSTAFSDKLYVNGDAYVTGGWRIGTGATYTGKIYNSSGIMSIETDSNRDIQFGDSGTPAVMYIDTSTEYVGIGTTAPADILTIAKANSQLRLVDTDDSKFVQFSYSGGKLITRNNSTNTTVNQITLTEDGKVGIGTITPGWQFVVQGAGSGSGLQDGHVMIRSTTAANPSGLMFINSGNTASYNDLGSIQGIVDSGNAKGALRFITRNSDGNNTGVAERMRISSAGDMIYGGATGVHEKTFSGIIAGSGTVSHDIVHTSDAGVGTILHIQATMTHHPSYDCILDTWVSRRTGTFVSTEQFRRNTGTSGSWAVSYVSSTVTRITKVAGTYVGGGPYWIKATWKNYD